MDPLTIGLLGSLGGALVGALVGAYAAYALESRRRRPDLRIVATRRTPSVGGAPYLEARLTSEGGVATTIDAVRVTILADASVHRPDAITSAPKAGRSRVALPAEIPAGHTQTWTLQIERIEARLAEAGLRQAPAVLLATDVGRNRVFTSTPFVLLARERSGAALPPPPTEPAEAQRPEAHAADDGPTLDPAGRRPTSDPARRGEARQGHPDEPGQHRPASPTGRPPDLGRGE